MIKYDSLIDTIKVDCSDLGFGPFSVLIVPEENENIIGGVEAAFYLLHKQYTIVSHMFSAPATTPKQDAETAYRAAPQYIPEYIETCFEED